MSAGGAGVHLQIDSEHEDVSGLQDFPQVLPDDGLKQVTVGAVKHCTEGGAIRDKNLCGMCTKPRAASKRVKPSGGNESISREEKKETTEKQPARLHLQHGSTYSTALLTGSMPVSLFTSAACRSSRRNQDTTQLVSMSSDCGCNAYSGMSKNASSSTQKPAR